MKTSIRESESEILPRNEIFDILETLVLPDDMPADESFNRCPVNQRNCICCLVETILSHRLSLSTPRLERLLLEFDDGKQSLGVETPSFVDCPKSTYAWRILVLFRILSYDITKNCRSTDFLFSGSEKRILSLAFDAVFYMGLCPLLPDGLILPLEKRLPQDSALRLSSTYSHSILTTPLRLQLLEAFTIILSMSLKESHELRNELIACQGGQHFEDFVCLLVYLSHSPEAKQYFPNDQYCKFLKILEDDVLPEVSMASSIRCMLSNLNRCSIGKGKLELSYASSFYGQCLSKLVVSNRNGVRNLLEVFMETAKGDDCDKIPRDEMWKRSSAVAAVLIRCPAFLKPSTYYPNIVAQLIVILDHSESKHSKILPAGIFGALLLQPLFLGKSNPVLSSKMSRFCKLYFYPALLGSSLSLNADFGLRYSEVATDDVDVSCLCRFVAIIEAIPKSVFTSMETSDLFLFILCLTPLALEVFAAFHTNTLLSTEVSPVCRSVTNTFLASFPIVPNSKGANFLIDWLLRPFLPKGLDFERPLIMPADHRPFCFKLETCSPSFDIEPRLNALKIVMDQLERSSYVCAIWSLLLSAFRRLILFLESKEEVQETASLYILLGCLSEDVAEFSETELSTMMMTPERFNSLVEFVGFICDRFAIISDSDELVPSGEGNFVSMLESTISMSMSIVSSVLVNKPGDSLVLSSLQTLVPKLEALINNRLLSPNCHEGLKAFLAICAPESFANSYSQPSNVFENLKISDSLREAISDISDPMCAVKGHGLINAKKVIESKADVVNETLVSELFRLFFQCLAHDDSYVHLNAASAIASLSLKFHQLILGRIANLYAGQPDEEAKIPQVGVETRLRIGECLCRIIKGLGEIAPVYRDVLLNSCLIAAKANISNEKSLGDDEEKEDAQVKLRASALSTLGQFAGSLKLSLATNSGEVLTCLAGYLNSRSEHLEVRRAAACALVLLLRGFEDNRTQIFHLADVLRDVGRVLRQNRASSLDDVLALHLDLGLEEIDLLGKILLKPETEFRSLIKPVTELD